MSRRQKQTLMVMGLVMVLIVGVAAFVVLQTRQQKQEQVASENIDVLLREAEFYAQTQVAPP